MNKWKNLSLGITPFLIVGMLYSHYDQGMKHLTSGNFDLAAEIFADASTPDAEVDNSDEKPTWSLDRVQSAYGHALCYWFGVGEIEPNREKAAEILEHICTEVKDAEMPGIANPAYLLGLYYDKKANGGAGGDDEDADACHKQAIRWYEMATRSGHSLARFRLGVIYHKLAEEYRQDGRNYDELEIKAEEYLRLARYDSNLSMVNRKIAEELSLSNTVQPGDDSWTSIWMSCRDAYYAARYYISKYMDYVHL